MSESGGTTTQSGIYYQNSIAALFLGRLIDPTRAHNQRIDSVRVEAPVAVDDIVITYSNGNKAYIQAKESLNSSSEAWEKLWCSFRDQATLCQTDGKSYTLTLIISNTSKNLQSLKELCERANGKNSLDEWWESLNTKHHKIAMNIGRLIEAKNSNSTFELLKTVDLKVIPLNDIENDYCPNWIPDSSATKATLFSHLRDMVGGYARIRRTFNCSRLLDELLSIYEITIPDSPNWGVGAYKNAIKNEFHLLSVPGTDLSGAIDDLFMWPELYESISKDLQDFEFEDLTSWREVKPKSFYELQNFPNEEISQAVINAGAGFGKSTLLKAIAFQLTRNPIVVPAFIPLSALIDSTSVISYLNTRLNDEYQVSIDWNYMSSTGRAAIFFDGLDELSDSERQNVLGKITKYVARYPQISYLLTVRDNSILTTQLDAILLEIRRLTDDKIIEFTKAYNRSGAIIGYKNLLDDTKHHPDLAHLLRIPLFLALVIATYKPNESLPRSRSEILERYLEILLSPEKYKPSHEKSDTYYLREATEYLAYAGLNKEQIGFNKKEALQHLRIIEYCEKPSEYLESLIKYGILTSVSSRLQFTYPTIQEYLAAQYLLENNPEELIDGFEKIIHRPWAQTIQFALESLPSSNEIIEKQLQKPDDAFLTSLRLIARCVVNGANVEKSTRKHLGELLAEAWPSDSFTIAESIGYLLLDGFTSSLPEQAEEYIIHGWALNYGGAKILSAKKDNILTERVLVRMLSKNLQYQYHLHDWQEAVNEIAEKALDLYIERALDENTNKEEIDALRSLISNLDENNIPELKWKSVVDEKSLPPIIRLIAAMKIPEIVQDKLQQLYCQIKKEWIESVEDYEYSYTFTQIFWNMPKCEFLKLIEERTITDLHIEKLILKLFDIDRVDEYHLGLIMKLYSSEILSDDMKFKLNLLLSSREDFADEVYAAEQLQAQKIDNIERWCFLIGHLGRETALNGLSHLSSRVIVKEEYIKILSSLAIGLNYIMKPTLSLSGTLDEKHYHPATPEFSNWLIEQYSQFEYNERELIKVLNDISTISPGKIEHDIEALINEILSSFEPSNEKDNEVSNFEFALSSGFGLCEREKIQLSESCLMKIISLERHNLMIYALRQILKVANKNTAETIIKIHNDLPSGHRRGMVLDTIEKLSNRFGFRVIDIDGSLQIAIR